MPLSWQTNGLRKQGCLTRNNASQVDPPLITVSPGRLVTGTDSPAGPEAEQVSHTPMAPQAEWSKGI